jgi:ribose 5-phosphate isomerase A
VREKIVDYRAEEFYVLVDEGKLCGELSGIVPVEVIPMAEGVVRRELALLGALEAPVRMEGKKKFISDNGNLILHAKFGKIGDPAELEWGINEIPGVVDNGLFTKSASVAVVVGSASGTARVLE